jgi:hypothetical protein
MCVFVLLFSCELAPKEASKKKKKTVLNGVKEYFKDGKLLSRVTYVNNSKEGLSTSYYDNGAVNMEINYSNNKKNGPYTWYYENGKVYQEGNYVDNEKQGVEKKYHKNGKLQSVAEWVDDEPAKGLKEYYPSGKLKPAPKIVFEEVNTIKLDGKYQLKMYLSNKNKYATFYESELEDGKYIPSYLVPIPSRKGVATLEHYLSPGQFIMRTITISAKMKTRYKNYYVLEQKFNVAVENR